MSFLRFLWDRWMGDDDARYATGVTLIIATLCWFIVWTLVWSFQERDIDVFTVSVSAGPIITVCFVVLAVYAVKGFSNLIMDYRDGIDEEEDW